MDGEKEGRESRSQEIIWTTTDDDMKRVPDAALFFWKYVREVSDYIIIFDVSFETIRTNITI